MPFLPTTDGVLAPQRRPLTLGILLAVAVFAADGMGVVPALPVAVRAVGGMAHFGWAFSGFMLAWLVGTVAGGQLSDTRGPFRAMASGLLGFGGGLLLAAGARGMGGFLAGRALQGAGGGAMIAAAYVAVARGYPDALRPRMMALTASVWIVPSVVGPALSGAVVQHVGWRSVFAGVVPGVALVAVLVLRPLRALDVTDNPGGRSRIPVALRLAGGAGCILATPDALTHGVLPAVVLAGLGCLLALPALHTLLPAGTMRLRRGLPVGIAARGLLALAFFGAEAFVPLTATDLRDATPTVAGLALSAASLGWIAMSWTQDAIESRHGAGGRVGRIRVGFLGVAMGIAVVAAVLLGRQPLVLVAVGWCVAGAGIGLAYTSGALVCVAAAPAGQEGEVSGQLQLAESLGTATGATAGGALLNALTHGGQTPRVAHGAVFVLTGLTALAGAALAGRVRSTSSPTSTTGGVQE